jgi:hypothetical protein
MLDPLGGGGIIHLQNSERDQAIYRIFGAFLQNLVAPSLRMTSAQRMIQPIRDNP